jgi:purine-nucleoside phosphorylase
MLNEIRETTEYLRKNGFATPDTGLILGTGLSGLASEIHAIASAPYHDIPHFPVSTVESHKGELIFGLLGGKKVIAMAGRFHYYEGYTMQQMTFPVRVMKELGVKNLIISNAAGSVNPAMGEGEIVLIKDHINLMPDNPLRGPNENSLGPRFPDLSEAYDRNLRQLAIDVATAQGLDLQQGVYAALAGPNLETPAEYRYMQRIGSDLVGMSTVPEVIVARHMEIPVLVFSVVSNLCYPFDDIAETTIEQVVAVVTAASKRLQELVSQILTKMP